MDIYLTSIGHNLQTFEEFFLIKDNNAYRIIIGILNEEVIIKCRYYEMKINKNNLSILKKSTLKTINDAYQYIITIFENNSANIKDIINNKSIKLVINNTEKDIELTLVYKNNRDDLNNNYNNINDEINSLKEEIKLLKKEINKLKKSNNTKEIDKDLNNINFLRDIVTDSYSKYCLSNTFSIFKSIKDILYLIYATENKSIIFYDIINNKKIKEIQKAHNENITNFRYYLDKLDKRDLVLSISAYDNNVKLWNINNFECLLNIKNINKNGCLYSACILNENNNNYIITSHWNLLKDCEKIKVFDFNGKKVKEINNSNDKIYFIDTYYDNKLSINYILTGNDDCIKSYNFNKNDIYKKYSAKDNSGHFSIIINDIEDEIKIIESSCDGNIRIWDFHSGELLNKIKVSNECLREISMWDNDYMFVGCDDKKIKIIELKNGIIIRELEGHNDYVTSIKQIIHPQYGKCLISQGGAKDAIKLWVSKN